jgi:uncharacterized membrane protein YqgA involved in biofilm formation
MVVKMDHILIVVGSLAMGSLLGEWMNLEAGAERSSAYLKKRFRIGSEKFSEGLITAFLLFCIGSMTILGTIQEGTGGSSDLLFTKSLMDFFSAMLLASAFGFGVIVSAIPLIIFQGVTNFVSHVCRFVFYFRNYSWTYQRGRHSPYWIGHQHS